jgi:hypothetical protein
VDDGVYTLFAAGKVALKIVRIDIGGHGILEDE